MTTNQSGIFYKCVPVLVIGTGISGLYTALKLASYKIQTLLVTKSTLEESNSRYAQGGIATVLPDNHSDSVELHVKDTLAAGAGLCNEAATRSILSEGYTAIEDLLSYGVSFDRDQDNKLALTQEAAHSVERIIHAGGDATGHSVEMALIDKVKQSPFIEVLSHTHVTELLTQDNQCCGCIAVQSIPGDQTIIVKSRQVVLATGGIGRLYSHTTNPAIATGNGIFLAEQAGASIQNMEFIQFHPTAFYNGGKLHFLVSEALRGEGGILRNVAGLPFAANYHEKGELAPRDIVTRAIFAEMTSASLPHVYLDITHLPRKTIEKRFPTILANCLELGCDIRKDWIPVAPAAHYLMGGITVDVEGKTTLKGLYTVGESAYTGLHGANRLASNSLLECVVLARRVAAAVDRHVDTRKPFLGEPGCYSGEENASRYQPVGLEDQQVMYSYFTTLREMMWHYVGILRDEAGLLEALSCVTEVLMRTRQVGWRYCMPDGFELYSQLLVTKIIIEASLARTESLGAHTRIDSDASLHTNLLIPAVVNPMT